MFLKIMKLVEFRIAKNVTILSPAILLNETVFDSDDLILKVL